MRRWRHVPVGMALLIGAACGATPTGEAEGLRVVATVSPITNLVQNVGGDRVRVEGIVPEGTNSHTFQPRPSDARLVAEADVVFMNGLHLEEPTLELARGNVRDGVAIVALGDEVLDPDEYIYDFSFPEEGGDPNPHLWTNPLAAEAYAGIIRDRLTALDRVGAETYSRNHEALVQRIGALDAAAREVTASVPEGDRKLLTYHDSFPYFAREYGWEIIGAIQPSDFGDPTPREVAALIEQIEEEDVPAIFGSEVFPSPVLEQIAEETGVAYVDDLRDDDLPGSQGDPDHSYVGLMVFDFRTFMGALGGDVAPFDDVDTTNVAGEGSATYRE